MTSFLTPEGFISLLASFIRSPDRGLAQSGSQALSCDGGAASPRSFSEVGLFGNAALNFLSSAVVFLLFKIIFFEDLFQECNQSNKQFGSRSSHCLGPNYLKKLSVDDTSTEIRSKYFHTTVLSGHLCNIVSFA